MNNDDSTSQQPARKPYKTPRLVQLGSVRELTASGGNTTSDNAVTMTKMAGAM